MAFIIASPHAWEIRGVEGENTKAADRTASDRPPHREPGTPFPSVIATPQSKKGRALSRAQREIKLTDSPNDNTGYSEDAVEE